MTKWRGPGASRPGQILDGFLDGGAGKPMSVVLDLASDLRRQGPPGYHRIAVFASALLGVVQIRKFMGPSNS